MRLCFSIDSWALKEPFVTAKDHVFRIETLTVYLRDGDFMGRGEALGVDYLGETPLGMGDQVLGVAPAIDAGASRRPANAAVPGWRPQRHRLRAVGPGMQARRSTDLATGRLARAAGHHGVHAQPGYTAGHGPPGCGPRGHAGAEAKAQRRRPDRPAARCARRAPGCGADNRRQRRLDTGPAG